MKTPSRALNSRKILIIGYGTAGRSLYEDLKKHRRQIAGFLDDKHTGAQILGKLGDANKVIAKHKITDVYFAIPSVSAKRLREFINGLDDTDVKISIIPRSFSILAKNTVNIGDLTDVDILSLVGRQPVKHDVLESQRMIKGKTVLVTGAAGSIGSKLVKLLAELNPKEIICVDWWENGIFFLQHDLSQQKNLTYKIADIRDPRAVDEIFNDAKPDIIFHAAAFKHVPLMQANPIEAFNNNVAGSFNLMRLAVKHRVRSFVYVSTDKAVNPVNIMGSTKRLGEMLMEIMAAAQTNTKFNAVRFGNVIQSNGSVMHTFKKQIDDNLPLTVTHRKVTRYFMTIEEAAQLIIQSAALAKSGEIFVLDMGEPIKIIDLANSLIKLLNKPVKIKITGLRPGEKLFEELSYDPKNVAKTANDKILVVKNEKPFNHDEFMVKIEQLIKLCRDYSISSQALNREFKNFGFKLKRLAR